MNKHTSKCYAMNIAILRKLPLHPELPNSFSTWSTVFFYRFSQYVYPYSMGHSSTWHFVRSISDQDHHQVENFLMNPTFTSKGGFRISLNGITIYQVELILICLVFGHFNFRNTLNPSVINLQKYGHLESEWDSAQMATKMLRKFQLFANKVPTSILKYPY